MAKATVAILLLAITVLLAGPVSARNKVSIGGSGRRLLDANASINQGGTASGQNAQVFSFGNSFASGNNPFGSFAATGGATAAISENNGKPSISTSIGTGFSDSLFGQSQSQTTSSSSSNGNPGTSVFQNVNVGSSFGGVGTQAGSSSGSISG